MRYDLQQMQQGDSGSAVAIAQRLLILYGIKGVGAVDGNFGLATTNAVKEFQRVQNLTVKDGIVGTATWNKLTHPAGTT